MPAKIRIDKSGRRGKVVTIVEGLVLHPEGKFELLRKLQKICGAGGSYDRGEILLQGDHRVRVAAELLKLGHQAKVVP